MAWKEKRKIKKSRRKKRNLGEEELRKKVDLQSTKTTIFYSLINLKKFHAYEKIVTTREYIEHKSINTKDPNSTGKL